MTKFTLDVRDNFLEQFDKAIRGKYNTRAEAIRAAMRLLLKGPVEKHNDFLMFKRTHFQVRDRALTVEAYLHFLAGYFGIIPTPEDLKIPEKGYFKIQKRE